MAELSKDALYQLFRRNAGDVEGMTNMGIPNMPTKEELQRLAVDLRWYPRLERDGVIVDFTRVEILKQRETQTIANLIQRLDQSLLPSSQKSENPNALPVLEPRSTEFARLGRLRIDVGKYYQLLLGEPTSRGETTDDERRKRLESMTPAELRELLVLTSQMRKEEEDKALLN